MRYEADWQMMKCSSCKHCKIKMGCFKVELFFNNFYKVFLLNPDYAHLDLTCFGYIIVTIIYVYICIYIHIYTYMQ